MTRIFGIIASKAHRELVTLSCALALGCGDAGAEPETPANAAGSAGANTATDTTTGGSFAAPTAGAATAGGATVGGAAVGGNAGSGGAAVGGAAIGGNAGSGGALGGGGSVTVDPNGGAPTGPASGRHTPRPTGSVSGTTAGYWEYLPPHYGNGARYPLLVFRHGVGENGNGASELQKVLRHGPPKLIEADQWPNERPFVVLSVQHPGNGCPSSQELNDFFEFATGKYDIDLRRVYLTGLSCGATASWNYLGDHVTETVAAAVLIAGDARAAFAKANCNLGAVPVWAFHGEVDTSVPPAYDGVPIASLKTCTNPAPVDLRYTTYAGVGHDAWTRTYDLSNPANDVYAWLLTHSN